ncbi:hypothetical protein HYFRA_00005730 [Hymenoscyphus fraxineus]|uniref:TMEM205-like domain-containing protein n=1 Tax=Hymenoscyphus fraxineus TaxID=746836 RepID=A0A9N9KPZ4_9HELO|nr:hypothetical protein HYFRA_00005730 [Hymenoscyphus fraxineus]
MPDLSILKSPAPYHIITYGTLLGATFFQSFVGGIIAFRALPRPMFSQLQQKIFPVYFTLQTALPAVLVMTYPGSSGPLGPPSSFAGTFAESNRYSVLLPIATMFITGLINKVYIGPETTRIMRERKVQETRDGKKSYDPAPHSNEMQTLNRAFGKMHGFSSISNLLGLIAMLAYGFSLAGRIQ